MFFFFFFLFQSPRKSILNIYNQPLFIFVAEKTNDILLVYLRYKTAKRKHFHFETFKRLENSIFEVGYGYKLKY